jgi:hypothetical protein
MAKLQKKPPKKTEIKNNLKETYKKKQTELKPKKRDARSLRKTGYTRQFNVMVTDEFRDNVYNIAATLGITQGKIITNALELYMNHLKKKGLI